ncbi:MAG: hypothetical protein QXE84_07960 [Candidatus Nitrosotenuis sp.]|nr:hypothetical protein [Candidatus Nitrosotenuis uzonensis]
MLNQAALDQEDRQKYINIVVAAGIAGAVIFLAQDIMEWLLGVDFENPNIQNIPPAITTMLSKILPFLRFVGGGLIVVVVIIAVSKLKLALRPFR